MSDRESSELGLQYANNEVCYPATLLVGDIIKAFKSGKYDPKTTAVAFVQTGGQCRATNYLPLIKKALIESGYDNVPVISLTFGGEIDNEQPGFEINWLKILPAALRTIIYGDCLAQFYYATLPRGEI
jgi:predicted nucleotide-binding protein (sugar kinase/HSP70/actin superfamily)